MFRIILSMIGIALMFLAFTILAPVTPEGAIIAAFAGLVIIAFLTVRTPVRKGIRRMPSNPQVLLPMMLFMLLPVMAFAQEATQEVPNIESFNDALILIIPSIVPVIIALAKKWFYTKGDDGKLIAPAWLPKGLLPILAVGLGALIAWVGGLASATGLDPLQGALLGALAVFVREFFKPLTQAASNLLSGS